MSSLTRSKLAEAQYFLAQIQALSRQPNAPFLPEVLYHLSALLSAARSVLWVMRHEYVRVSGWEQWFKDRDLDSTGKDLFRRFSQLRNDAVKKGAAEASFVPMILPKLSNDPAAAPRATFALLRAGTSESQPLIVEGADLQWMVELEGREVLFSSSNYVALLSQLVGECEAKFQLPNDK